MTHNGSDPTVVRIWNVTTDGFNIKLQEERGNDGAHTAETVNYIALEGNVKYQFGINPDGLCSHVDTVQVEADETWVSTGKFKTSHVLVGLQTKNGGDPANARWKVDCFGGKPCKAPLEVRVDEEASDGESNHALESVGVMRMWVGACE